MPYVSNEELWFVGEEDGTRGEPDTLTLANQLDTTGESTMEPSSEVTERLNYPGTTVAGMPLSSRPGKNSWNATLVCDMKGVDGALTTADDTDWDTFGVDALLKACRMSNVTDATGTRTYAGGGLSTGSSNEQVSCTIATTDGPLLKRAVGCAGNFKINADDGSPARWTFEMQGVYQPPFEGAVSGGSAAIQAVSPASHLQGVIEIGTLDTLCISSVAFDAGNTVASIPARGPLLWPLYRCFTDTDGAEAGLVDKTTDINDAGASDVTVFLTAPTSDNSNNTIYFGMEERFHGLKIKIGTAGVTDITVTWQYWDGVTAAWTTYSTFGQQEVSDFDEAAGTYYNTWEVPRTWEQTSVNSVTAYYVRATVSSFTSNTTQAALTQAWAMVPSFGHKRFLVTGSNPKLSVTLDAVDPDTYDPIYDFYSETINKKSTAAERTIVVPFGTADNNTWILTMTGCFVAAHPSMSEENGLRRMGVEFGCTAFTLQLT